ncbi:MAG: PP2C family protein-serine/threonine phosphatase [Planctomycetota bacterium]
MNGPEFYLWREEAEAPAQGGGEAEQPRVATRFQQQKEEFKTLMRITEQVNRGVTLDEILDFLYQHMQQVIPYNRIGVALIDEERGVVVSRCVRSDHPIVLHEGYEGQLAGSTLQRVVETGKPRIINDLVAYGHEKPHSEPTQLILQEDMRSSLTCPLIVQGKPVGFVFFTSVESHRYSDTHVAFFQQIAGHLATIVEKGRLYDELARQREILERKNRAMTRDLDMARSVQRALIPHQPPPMHGLQFALKYEPVAQVGGDILDIVPLGRRRAICFVADAMGHGVQAALVMSAVKAALFPAIQSDPRPARILENMNGLVIRLFGDSDVTFVTAVCCLLDASKPRAELALAGHRMPLWFRASTRDVIDKSTGSLPLGVAEDTTYEPVAIELSQGDSLVFCTDGIPESLDTKGIPYGTERLYGQVERHGACKARELRDHIWENFVEHCGNRPRCDDVTLLVAKIDPMDEKGDAGENEACGVKTRAADGAT